MDIVKLKCSKCFWQNSVRISNPTVERVFTEYPTTCPRCKSTKVVRVFKKGDST